MADRVLTAEMILSGKDAGVSDMLAKIAKNVDAVSKQAAHTEQIQGFAKSLVGLDKQMAAIDKMARSASGLTMMQERAVAAAANVDKLRGAMSRVTAPTAAMTKTLVAAEMAQSKAAFAATRQADALKLAEKAVRALNLPTDNAIGTQTRLAQSFEHTTRAAETAMMAERKMADVQRNAAEASRLAEVADHRRRELAHRNGVGHLATTVAAGAVTAHAFIGLGEETYKAGASYQHQLVGLQNVGRTPEEIKAIVKAAVDTVKAVPTSTFTENLETVKETTEAFGDVHHAMNNLAFLQKTSSVLHSAVGDKVTSSTAQIGRAMAKYYEERMRPPEEFQKELSAMVPAMVASGGQFNPDALYQFAQGAKSALPGYSLEFMRDYAPSLIARNGERAGTSAFAFDSVISGKARDKKQAAEWERLGLLDRRQVIGGKDGPIGWKAGAVKGTRLASENPVDWAEQVLIPAMKRKGINTDDRQAVKVELATLFRNGMSNFFATEIVQAQSRRLLHKNAELNRAVGSTDDLYKRNLTTDPTVAMTGLTSAFENLLTTVSSDAMAPAAQAINWVAESLTKLSLVAKDHPKEALAVGGGLLAGGLGLSGWLTARMLGGFGLPRASEHLEVSSLALREAAGVLGASRGVPGAPGGSNKPGASPSLAAQTMFLGFNLLGLAANAPGLDEAGDKTREANANALDGLGHAFGYDYFDGLRQRMFGKDGDVTTWLGGLLQGGAPVAPVTPAALPTLNRGYWQHQEQLMHPAVTGASTTLPVAGPMPPARPSDVTLNTFFERYRTLPALPTETADSIERMYGEFMTRGSVHRPPSGPPTASAFHPEPILAPLTSSPADMVDRMRERQDAVDAAAQQWEQDLKDSGFTLGQLDNAARSLAMSFASLQGATPGGGGGGIINASWGGGSLGGGGAGSGGAFNLSGGGATGEHADFIRRVSAKLGIDPRYGVAVAKSEGLGHFVGDKGTSFGDFQLHYRSNVPGMTSAGLGDAYERETGHSARNAAEWKMQDEWALKYIARNGWAPWHGAARIGIHGKMGIGTYHGPVPDEHPALAAPPLRRRGVPPSDVPTTSAHNELVGAVRQMTAAVERGGLHRVHLALDKGVSAKKVYQRGNMGMTIA